VSVAKALPMDIVWMRRTSHLLLLLLCAAVALVGLWMRVRPLFALAGIRVQGDVTHNNLATLRANVLPRLSGNFFTLDLQQARQAFEALPWVRQALVQREFPNRIKVTLTEHQAVAVWGNEDEGRLLNSYGEIFVANLDDSDTLSWPRLSGPPQQSGLMLQVWRLLQAELQGLGTPLQALDLSERGSWRLRLGNEGVIEMGRGSPAELQARARRLMGTLSEVTTRVQRNPGRDLISADLRYADGYALKLRGVTTASPHKQQTAEH